MKAGLSTLAILVAALAACSSNNDDGSGASAATGAQTGAGPATGSGGNYEPPPDSITVKFGPIDVDPGVEKTQCVTKRLGNATALHIGQIHNELIGVSHHMIVYKVSDTEEKPDPYDCQPFTDTLDATKGSPLMITQKHSETLQLPTGVGFNLEANQMVRLEMHYINAGATKGSIEGDSTFVPIKDEDFTDEAGFLFAGSIDIDIAAHEQQTVDAFVKLPSDKFAGKHFFGFTGHEHKFGTGVTVAMGADKTDPGTMVYDPEGFTWSEPPTEYHDPPIDLPSGAGFHLNCTFDNTSDQHVKFGESANDEMCFFWSYYYPNVGSLVCFHTEQFPGGIDACCPGGPAQLCNGLGGGGG